MKVTILIISLLLFEGSSTGALPDWFTKTFDEKKLDLHYSIIQPSKPAFLEADFNGDGKKDIAVQIMDIKTKKKGILIINAGESQYYTFGAGQKLIGESFNDTNWLSGWKIYRNKTAYKSRFNKDGDMISGRKIKLKCPAVYIYHTEDGDDVAGQLIYWDGIKYISIHQGE
jgi:hypothetical protein